MRCEARARTALRGMARRTAATPVVLRRLIARSGRKLVDSGRFLLNRAIDAGATLSSLTARLVAVATEAAVQYSVAHRGVFRDIFTWARRRSAGFHPVFPRTLAIGIGAAALVFLMFAVAWVGVREPSTGSSPRVAAIPNGEDLESEIAALRTLPDGGVVEPAPVPSRTQSADASTRSDNRDEGPVGVPPVNAEPVPALPSTGLALLPEKPRARPRRGRPQWLVNAVKPDLQDAGPLIAIVIDDVGIAQKRTARTIDLPAPLTLAFIPYGANLEYHTRHARQRGHELIVHVPMEPSSSGADPGPNALLTGLEEEEIMRRFVWGLSQFDGYVGVSNHMGSRFMARDDLLAPLLAVTQERGLLFLDSRTTADTVGSDIADRLRLPNARRDVFLDNEITVENVTAQLAETERLARQRGYAVAIGHPHDVTVDVLAEWIPGARARGFTLVPISTIVRLDYGADYEAELAAAIPAGGEPEGFLGRPQ